MAEWKNLDQILYRFVEEKILAGCGMQIFKDGEKIYDQCFGAATLDGSKTFTADTRTRMHSMTKNYTCTALMTLYDKGLFAFDDPIEKYLPEFSNMMVCRSQTDLTDLVPANHSITIRNLLSMQSGIPYWAFSPLEGVVQQSFSELAVETAAAVKSGKKNSLEAFVKEIAARPLCFQPGERWMYGLSLTVIGRLIEVLSGMNYAEYLKKMIWEPLEMNNICFSTQLTGEEEIADLLVEEEVYRAFRREPESDSKVSGWDGVFRSKSDVLPGSDLGVELPCGGLISTLNNNGKLFSMLANRGSYEGKRILGRRTVDLMRTNQLSSDQMANFSVDTNRGFGYALGFRTMMNPSVAGFYMPEGSFGWDGASGCYGLADPDHKVAFVFSESSVPHHIGYTIPRVVAAMNADIDLF